MYLSWEGERWFCKGYIPRCGVDTFSGMTGDGYLANIINNASSVVLNPVRYILVLCEIKGAAISFSMSFAIENFFFFFIWLTSILVHFVAAFRYLFLYFYFFFVPIDLQYIVDYYTSVYFEKYIQDALHFFGHVK